MALSGRESDDSLMRETSTLGVLLRTLRGRLDPNAATLGGYVRLLSRRGRIISQDEVAEAIGVSRRWYTSLESGASSRPSFSLVTRLANTLNVDCKERLALFQVAFPALKHITEDAGVCPSCGTSVQPRSRRSYPLDEEAKNLTFPTLPAK
jgi:transcriptional regulator with XRE-family HTH domain